MAEVNWRPIDTAPRDGTPVLLWGEVFLGIFHWGDPGSVLSGRPHPPGWVGCTVIPPGLDNTDMLGPITLAAYVRNVFDKRVVFTENARITRYAPIDVYDTVGRPRTAGVELTYRW